MLCRPLIGAPQKIGMGRLCRLLYDDRAWALQLPARKLFDMYARLSMWWPADPAATPTRA